MPSETRDSRVAMNVVWDFERACERCMIAHGSDLVAATEEMNRLRSKLHSLLAGAAAQTMNRRFDMKTNVTITVSAIRDEAQIPMITHAISVAHDAARLQEGETERHVQIDIGDVSITAQTTRENTAQ